MGTPAIFKETFDEIMKWKKRVVSYYQKHNSLSGEMCSWKWDTYEDMMKAMSFMKHELKVDKYTSAMHEDLINR